MYFTDYSILLINKMLLYLIWGTLGLSPNQAERIDLM